MQFGSSGMRKKIVFLTAIFIIVFCAFFTACTGNTDNEDGGEDTVIKKPVSISVDKATIPGNVYAGDVRLPQITLNILYDNNETESIPLTNEYISVKSLNLLNQPGTQTIEVVYENCKCTFSIVLLDPDDVQYNLKITGGIPVQVNGTNVSYQVTDGIFEAKYDKGTEIVIDWIEEEGKVFGHWKANGEVVDNQRMTSVVLNENFEYVAYAEDFLYSVTFLTYNENVSIAQIKAKSINSASDIIDEMAMDDYVFVGWTTKEITREESLSGTVKEGLIEFPYEISDDVTFYAVWTPIGFSYTTVSIEYAGKRVDGKEIVSYTGLLTDLEIPSTSDGQDVIAISKDAFSGDNAKYLTTITIPSTVISIEEGSFKNCTSLQSFYVDASSRNFSAEKGSLYQNDKSVLLAYPSGRVTAEYIIESAVTKICDYALYNAVVGGVVLSSEVTNIGSNAFNSVHINYVDLSLLSASNISSIGENIFSNQLSAIYVDMEEESGYKSLLSSYSDKILTDSSALDSIYTEEIESGITVLFKLIIGEYFDSATRTAEVIGITRTVTDVSLPETLFGRNNYFTVSSIGEYAFKDCIALEKLNLPSGLERVCDNAFDDTPWAAELENSSVIFNNTLYKYLGHNYTYILDESVIRIAEGAFAGNTDLEAVDITNNVVLERIDAYAFDGCLNLKTFAIGANGYNFLVKPLLTKIAPYAFRGTAIKTIETQSAAQGESGNLSYIGDYAFASNFYLEEVELSMTSLNEISSLAFYDCFALQEINVAENEKYQSFSGILYKKLTDGDYELFHYPAGKMKGVFNPSKPDENTEITVASLGEYSLRYANIGALELEESVEATNANAVVLPSVIYIRFLAKSTLHNAFYKTVFANTGAEKIVFERELSGEIISAFFGQDEELCRDLKTYEIPCEFYITNGLLYSVNKNNEVGIVGADRTSAGTETVIPETVVLNGVTYNEKYVNKYAFWGYNLKSLTVSGVNEFKQYALTGATKLSELILTASRTEDIPWIFDSSLGENFNKSLKITVCCNPNETDSYFDKWDGIIETFTYSDEYGVEHIAAENMFYGEPFAVLTYLDNNDIRQTSSIQYGEINENAIDEISGKRPGYYIGGWKKTTGSEEDIVIEAGYKINSNMILECKWVAEKYTLTFAVPEGIVLEFNAEYSGSDSNYNYYTYEIEFGTDYNFSVQDSDANIYNFNGWMLDEENLPVKGTWSKVSQTETVILYPSRSKKEYRIIYDTSDDTVKIDGTGKTVYYGENYVLDIPLKEGYDFVKWSMLGQDGTYIGMTDENGASYTEWRISTAESVVFYPEWSPKALKVTLMLGENEKYTEKEVIYGSDNYKLELLISDVPLEYREKYNDIIEFFAGWQDEKGKTYTNSSGDAVVAWDKTDNAVLYAVWPDFIYDETELFSVIQNNRKASVVLMSDIELTEPISGEYTGVFNGNNHTVNVVQEISSIQDIYSGIFEINSGTIKNIDIFVNLTINVATEFNLDAYYGGVCGVNNGIIENVTLDLNFNAVFNIISGNVFVGGLFGLSGGTVNDCVTNVNEFSLTVTDVEGGLFAGSGAGVNYGTINFTSIEIKNFVVNYGGKPFGGEINTVGSIIGANTYFDENSGKEIIGTVKGSSRITTVKTENEFEIYVDATASASQSNINNNWESDYVNYYCYDGIFMKPATVVYLSTIKYYEKQKSSKDYFAEKNHRFGEGRGGNNEFLAFSVIENNA